MKTTFVSSPDNAQPFVLPPTHYRGPDGEDAAHERVFTFSGRTQIYRQGDLVDWIYQITRGVVMLSKLLPDGRRQVVEFLGAGDVFGLSSMPVHDCSAEALTGTRCVAFDRANAEGSPELMRRINASLYRQFCTLQNHVALLGRKTAMERIASFLMRWVPGRGGYNCPGNQGGSDRVDFKLTMSRQEIADYLGLTIETVSRLLTTLRRKGVLSINHVDGIRVLDVCRLCQMTGTHLTSGRWCSARDDGPIKDPWT